MAPADYAPRVASPIDPVASDPLPAAPLASAFRGGRRQRLRAGAVVFNEGDISKRVMLLLAGRAKVSRYTDEGQETVLAVRVPGEVLGELSAIDGGEHVATVTIVEDGEALVITADEFMAALRAEPELAVRLLAALVEQLRDADRKRSEFVALDVVGRVAQRLLELAASFGVPAADGVRIDLPLSQRELAGWVGASREAVNKALAQLEAQGLITSERRSIVVRDRDGLRTRAS